MALSEQHHGELNKSLSVRPERYDQLRKEYSRDTVALQQIDVYDGSTAYHTKLRLYIEALKSGDDKSAQELEVWFKKHYPDIK